MGKNFNNIGIEKKLEKELINQRIYSPTLIQELTIPEILNGVDVIGKAQTGTGKTLSFMLPIFQNIETNSEYIQALIISPTRELARQLYEEALNLKGYKDVNILCAYGGEDVNKQLSKLKRGIDIVIATPGRLLDHINRGSIDLSKVKYLVIDEADEIINMGFFNDVEEIINKTPKSRQTLLFSATILPNLKNTANRFMKKPVIIEAKEESILEEQIEEKKIYTTDRQKYDDLIKYLNDENPFMSIIFCRTKRRVQELTTKLKQDGYNVDELHGDLSQAKRNRAMKNFRDLKTQYLIATDIAARGLDIEGISHVINYDEPDGDIKYTHRIGRTGRAGEEGVAVTFIVKDKK